MRNDGRIMKCFYIKKGIQSDYLPTDQDWRIIFFHKFAYVWARGKPVFKNFLNKFFGLKSLLGKVLIKKFVEPQTKLWCKKGIQSDYLPTDQDWRIIFLHKFAQFWGRGKSKLQQKQ